MPQQVINNVITTGLHEKLNKALIFTDRSSRTIDDYQNDNHKPITGAIIGVDHDGEVENDDGIENKADGPENPPDKNPMTRLKKSKTTDHTNRKTQKWTCNLPL